MITVAQWETGEVKLSNEIFEPCYLRPKSIMDRFIKNPLMAFRGAETGTYIEKEFADILER